MQYGYGFGRGFGFRGSSPPWPYIGAGRGGLPRCWYYLGASAGHVPTYGRGVQYRPYGRGAGAGFYAAEITKEQELDFLRNEAEVMREELEQVDGRIRELTSEVGRAE